MSVKFFSGLGLISGLAGTTPASQTTLANGNILKVPIVATPVLGTIVLPSKPLAPLPPYTTVLTKIPETFSQFSGYAPHETLYHEFSLQVFPTYNFYVADEETNDTEALGSRNPDDVPRYNRLVWDVAPDLPDTNTTVISSPTKQVSRKPVQFSTQIMKGQVVTQKGVTFDPEHLKNFDLVKGSLSDFYIAPGVLHAVVDLPLQHTNLQTETPKDELIHYVDEDSFLTNPSTEGVSIQELKSNVHTVTNGLIASADVAATSMSANISAERQVLFDGQFSVEKPTTNGGILRISSVAASSPVISIAAQTPLSNEPALSDQVSDLIEKVQQTPASQDVDRSLQNRVKFVNPSITGIISEEKVNHLAAPEHVENMVSIAQLLPNLEVLSNSGLSDSVNPIKLPSFSSPTNLKPVEYVGYVIEKYKKGSDGTFSLVDTISIKSREYSSYLDTKILYGAVYRYRIKAIARWTHSPNVGPEGPVPYTQPSLSTNARPTAFNQSSYFSGEWCAQWAYAVVLDTFPPQPPDELTVRPDSVKGKITVTFKLPYNPKRDIYSMLLYRKLVDQNGQDITNWKDVGIMTLPMNFYYEDFDVANFQDNGGVRYVYAAQTMNRHWEYSFLSEQMAARLNRDVQTFGEYPVEQISQAGVRVDQHGSFSVRPFRKFVNEIVVPEQFTLGGRAVKGSRSMATITYFVRVESLDTGERKDYELDVSYNNQPTIVNKLGSNVYISNQTKVASANTGVIVPRTSIAPVTGKKELTTRMTVATRRNQLPGSIT